MASFNLTAELNLRGPSNLNQVVSNIRRQLSTISLNLNINPATSRGIQAVTTDVRNLSVALRDAQTNAVTLSTTLRGLGASISGVASSTSGLGSNLANVSRGASGTAKAIKAASSEMTEFGRQSALAVRRFAAFSVATGSIYALARAITSAYSEFVVFNKEFVRLQQVTESSAAGLSSLSNEITRLATNFGVSSRELLQVSVTLAQAGLTAGETKTALEALAKSALAPSFDSLNDTVEGSIALMRQFGIGAADLESSLGSVNAVAAKFAVEASDIISAIQRTGGVFANASKGVSEGKDALNEFLAVFTSVRATTRESAETIATGLRTIFTRIQRGSTIEALKQYGIELTDLEGKFVGPYEAVRRLSEGLKTLDPRDLRFSSIVEELGGFRQIGKVIPLIQQFETAQKALGVAQRGAGSLALDAATAQEALSVRINKVREEFVGLIRDIGQSQGFQTFVDISLKLASALISVADAAKGVLPALAAITAIRGVGALGQFFGGFAGGVSRNRPRGFASGGFVPGKGSGDTVPAMLTPGEFVIRKKAVQTIGVNKLQQMNKYAGGGKVPKFASGGYSDDEWLKEIESIRRKYKLPSQFEIDRMSPTEKRAYEDRLGQIAFSSPSPGREKKALQAMQQKAARKSKLGLFFSAAGMKRGPKAPPGAFQETLSKYQGADGGLTSVKPKFIAWGKGQGSFADVIKGSEAKIKEKLAGSQLDQFNKLISSGSLSNYISSGGKMGHIPPLKKAIYSILGVTGKNTGGIIQKFNNGQGVKKVSIENKIRSGMKKGKQYQFGLVGLRSGTKGQFKQTENFEITKGKEPNIKSYPITLHKATFAKGVESEEQKQIESNIQSSFAGMVNNTASILSSKLGSGKAASAQKMQKILKGSSLTTVVGSVFEAALASLGSPYIEKTEKTKSMDFPLGLGPIANSFGIPANIPTDATRTVGGSGKGTAQMKQQIKRFIGAVEGEEFTKSFTKMREKRLVEQKITPQSNQNVQGMLKSIFDRLPRNATVASALGPAKTDMITKAFGIAKNKLNKQALTGTGKQSTAAAISAQGGDFKKLLEQLEREIPQFNADGGFIRSVQKFSAGGNVKGISSSKARSAILGKQLSGAEMVKAARRAGYDIEELDNGLVQLSRNNKIMHTMSRAEVSELLGSIATGYSKGGLAKAPLIDDILNANGTILPRPSSAIQALIRAGGGAVDIDRTLKRTIGDKAYGMAKTPGQQSAALEKYFRDPNSRLQDIISAPLTTFGQELRTAIKSGQLKPNKLSIISKSLRTPGVAEYLNQLFGIPTANMVFTQGGSKEPALEALRTKGPRINRIQKFAFGGSVGEDTVPALLTPGEFVINKKAAQKIGSAKLNKLNKADKIQGFNKGGAVGHIQKFAFGGSTLPARTTNPTGFNVVVPPTTVQALQEIVRALQNMGVAGSEVAKILEKGGAISVRASERAYQTDLDRLRIAGASASDIYNTEQRLAEIRRDNARKIDTSRELGGFTGQRLQNIQTRAEAEQVRITQALTARGATPEQLDANRQRIRDRVFENVTAAEMGTSRRGLAARGMSGGSIQEYINQSMMDSRSLRQMNQQLMQTREQEIQARLRIAASAGASAQEQRALARELRARAIEEITERKNIVKQLRSERGLSGGTFRSTLGALQTTGALFGLGDMDENAFGQRGRGFSRGWNKASQITQRAGFGLTFAGGLIGDTVGKMRGGKEGQAISAAVSTFVGSAGIGMMFGPIGALTGAIVGATSAIQTWKDSLLDSAMQEESDKIENSSRKIQRGFEQLNKSTDKAQAGSSIKAITEEMIKTASAQREQQKIIADKLIPDAPGSSLPSGFQWMGSVFRSLTGARGAGSSWDPTGYSGRLLDPTTQNMGQVTKEIISSAQQTNILQTLPQILEAGVSSGLSLAQVEAKFLPGELDRQAELFALAMQDVTVASLVAERQRRKEIDPTSDTTDLDRTIRERSSRLYRSEITKPLQDRIKAEEATAAAAAAAVLQINLLNQALTKISSAASKSAAQFEEAQRQIAIGTSILLGGGKIQGPDRSQENVLENILSYSVREIRDIIGRIGTENKFNPALIAEAQDSAVSQRILQEELPRILAEIGAREGEGFDPEGDSAKILGEKLDQVFKKFITDNGRRGEIVNRVVKNLQEKLSKRGGSVSMEELAQDERAFAEIMKVTGEVFSVFGNLVKQNNDTLAVLNQGLNIFIDRLQQASDMRLEAQNIGIEAQNKLSAALGEELSLSDLNAPFENTIKRLSERLGKDGKPIAGTGTTDPATIMQRMVEKEKEAQDLERRLGEQRQGTPEYDALASSLARTRLEASNLAKAHEKLRSDSSRASNALAKISELRQLQESRQSSFLDILKDINNPEAMDKFVNEVRSFFAQMAGEGSIQNLPQAIAGLERQMALLPAEQAAKLRTDFIASLGPMFAGQRGPNGQPIVNNMGLEALDDIISRLGAGRERPADMQAAINEFHDAVKDQTDAMEQAAQKIEEGANAAKDALIQGGAQAANNMAGAGQNNPRQNIPLQDPARRQRGGLIYASEGQYVNFQPRGTDTVPAMLTPGEFVVNAKATKKNRGLLESINNNAKIGGYNKGGVVYLSKGGYTPVDTTIDSDWQNLLQQLAAFDEETEALLTPVKMEREKTQGILRQLSFNLENTQNEQEKSQIQAAIDASVAQWQSIDQQINDIESNRENTKESDFGPIETAIRFRRENENLRRIAQEGELSDSDKQALAATDTGPADTYNQRQAQREADRLTSAQMFKEREDDRKKTKTDYDRDMAIRGISQDKGVSTENATRLYDIEQQRKALQAQRQAEKERKREEFLSRNPYYRKKAEEKLSREQQEKEEARKWYLRSKTKPDGSWDGDTTENGAREIPDDVLAQYKKNKAQERSQVNRERILFGSPVLKDDPEAQTKKQRAQRLTQLEIAEQLKMRRGEELARKFGWSLNDTKVRNGGVIGTYRDFEEGDEPYDLRTLKREDKEALDSYQTSRLHAREKLERESADTISRLEAEREWEETKTRIAAAGAAARAEEEKRQQERDAAIAAKMAEARKREAEMEKKRLEEAESARTIAETEKSARQQEARRKLEEKRNAVAANKQEQTDRIQDMVSTVAIPEVDEKKVRQLFDEPEITTPDQRTNIPEITGLDVRIDPITGRPIDTSLDPRLLSGQLNQTLSDLERLRQEQYFNNSSTTSIEQMLKDEYAAAMAEIDRRKAAGEFAGRGRYPGDAERKARLEAGQKTRLGQFYSQQGGGFFTGPEDYATKYVDSMSRQEKEQLRKERREQLAEQQRVLKEQGRTTAVQLAESRKAQAAELERKQARIAETKTEFEELRLRAANPNGRRWVDENGRTVDPNTPGSTRVSNRLSRWELDTFAEMAVERKAEDVNLFGGDRRQAEDNIRRRSLTDQEFYAARMREQKEFRESQRWGAGEAFTIGAAKSAAPTAVGLKVGAATTAATAPFLGPFAPLAGLVAGGGAAILTSLAQEKALDTVAPKANAEMRRIAEENQVASALGTAVTGFGPGLAQQGVRSLGGTIAQRAASGAIGATTSAGIEYVTTGEVDLNNLAIAFAAGAAQPMAGPGGTGKLFELPGKGVRALRESDKVAEAAWQRYSAQLAKQEAAEAADRSAIAMQGGRSMGAQGRVSARSLESGKAALEQGRVIAAAKQETLSRESQNVSEIVDNLVNSGQMTREAAQQQAEILAKQGYAVSGDRIVQLPTPKPNIPSASTAEKVKEAVQTTTRPAPVTSSSKPSTGTATTRQIAAQESLPQGQALQTTIQELIDAGYSRREALKTAQLGYRLIDDKLVNIGRSTSTAAANKTAQATAAASKPVTTSTAGGTKMSPNTRSLMEKSGLTEEVAEAYAVREAEKQATKKAAQEARDAATRAKAGAATQPTTRKPIEITENMEGGITVADRKGAVRAMEKAEKDRLKAGKKSGKKTDFDTIREKKYSDLTAEEKLLYDQRLAQENNAGFLSGKVSFGRTIKGVTTAGVTTGLGLGMYSGYLDPFSENYFGYDEDTKKIMRRKPKYRTSGGPIYASKGTLVSYQPRGTDTVPAMLTPGEFVVNRKSAKQNMGLLKAINNGHNVQPLAFNKGGIVPTQYYADGVAGVSGSSSSGGGVSSISVDASALDAAFSNFNSYVSSLSSVIDGFTQGTTELAGLSQAIGALGNLGLREGASLMANAGISVKEATTAFSSAMTEFNSSATSLATAISTIPKSISLTVSGSIPVTVSVQIEGGSGAGTDTAAIEQSIMDKVALAINSATQGGINIDTAIS